ncbi:MAG: NAD(P)/FAD-dependent oxidoreductase [Myxococcota bacterium]
MVAEHLDVIIIGAGLSGIGAAVHLRRAHPGRSLAILEMRGAIGGTWDLFRYPGIRSDSDMYTLGYNFKPWTNPVSIAGGRDILAYIRETAAEFDVEGAIRFHHRVVALDWSSPRARWELTVRRDDTDETITLTCSFVVACTGYYKYAHGHTPEFAGRETFRGTVVHPQQWPEDLEYAGKRVVVIGSGATAVTLVPALAERAAAVTMLQRSPSYVASVPRADGMTDALRRVLPEAAVYAITRFRNVLLSMGLYGYARWRPQRTRDFLLRRVAREVGEHVDLEHFSPRYDVWDERLCAVPDGDLFEAIRNGQATVVTDHIDRFVPEGVRLASGRTLEADIVVTATGLVLEVLGGSDFRVDGEPVNTGERLYYKGAMLEGVPNMAMVFGYINASWTLKADLIADLVCRVLRHMDDNDYAVCTPRAVGVGDEGPFVTLKSGYFQRAHHLLPRQGDRAPWRLYQNYFKDYAMMKLGGVEDGALVFTARKENDDGGKKACEVAYDTT